MADVTEAHLTRRQMLKASGTAAAAAGYALSVETVLAQAITARAASRRRASMRWLRSSSSAKGT